MAEKMSKLAGTLLQRLYAPRGELEGVLLDTEKGVVQLVLDRNDVVAAEYLMGLQPGSQLQAQVSKDPQPGKDGSRHPVHVLGKLMGAGRASAAAGFNGVVMAFHYTRHGEPNGVMLDSGHFVHTGPEGLAGLVQLDVGDLIQVRGPAKPLGDGTGMVIEASHINGKAVKRAAAKKAVKKAAKKAAKKAVETKAVKKMAAKKPADNAAGKGAKKTVATKAGKSTATRTAAKTVGASARKTPQKAAKVSKPAASKTTGKRAQ